MTDHDFAMWEAEMPDPEPTTDELTRRWLRQHLVDALTVDIPELAGARATVETIVDEIIDRLWRFLPAFGVYLAGAWLEDRALALDPDRWTDMILAEATPMRRAVSEARETVERLGREEALRQGVSRALRTIIGRDG